MQKNIFIILLIIIFVFVILYNCYEKVENMMEYHPVKNTIRKYIYRVFKKPYRHPYTYATSYPENKMTTYGIHLVN
jgi:hypothetical protein